MLQATKYTLLAPAICRVSFDGDHMALDQLLRDGVSPNEVDTNGYYPLHYAAMHGHIDCLEYLLKTETVNVNQESDNYNSYTALHFAVRSDRNPLSACRILIEHGAEPTAVDSESRTALHIACMGKNLRLIELLLTKETALSETSRQFILDFKFLPHHIAIESSSNEALEMLFAFCDRNQIALTTRQQYQLAAVASHKGNLQALRMTFEKYGSVNKKEENDDYLLALAVDKDHYDCVRFLVEQGYQPIPRLKSQEDDDRSDTLTVASGSKMLNAILPAITSKVVQEYNDQSERGTVVCHPLFNAVNQCGRSSEKAIIGKKNLSALLQLGIDPALPVMDDEDRDLTLFGESALCPCGIRLTLRRTSEDDDHLLNIISWAIFTIEDRIKLREIVDLLLSYEASVNAEFNDEITPVVALAMRDISQWGKQLWGLFDRILDEGAELNFHSANSSFMSPDVAIAAALQRNDIILAVVFERTDLSTADLLSELKKVTYHTEESHEDDESDDESDEDDETLNLKRTQLRVHIGHAILTILRSSVDRTPEITTLCQELDEHFAPVDSNVPCSSKCSPWSKIRSELGTGPLQNRCCRVIRHHFLEIGKYQQMDTYIRKLPLPMELKKFLMF